MRRRVFADKRKSAAAVDSPTEGDARAVPLARQVDRHRDLRLRTVEGAGPPAGEALERGGRGGGGGGEGRDREDDRDGEDAVSLQGWDRILGNGPPYRGCLCRVVSARRDP